MGGNARVQHPEQGLEMQIILTPAEDIIFVILWSCHLQRGPIELLAFCPLSQKATVLEKTLGTISLHLPLHWTAAARAARAQ